MAGSHGNTVAIQNGSDIVWMDSVEHEGKHPDFLAGSAEYPKARDRAQQFCPVRQQFSFVSGRAPEPNPREVFQRGAESDGPRNMGRTRLEFVRQFVIGRLFKRDGTDHVTARLIRGHPVEQLLTSVENTDAGRPEYL